MKDHWMAVAGIILLFVIAELLRPYRLRVEASARKWERDRYEKMARREEEKAALEENRPHRHIYLDTAAFYRDLAKNVR